MDNNKIMNLNKPIQSDVMDNVGIYLGIIEVVPNEGMTEFKVRIPEIDGVESSIDSLPAAYPSFNYVGNNFGAYFPYSIEDVVIVSILRNIGHRIILGSYYKTGELPRRFNDKSNQRGGKVAGIQTPNTGGIFLCYADGDEEILITTRNGYKISCRADSQLPNTDNPDHTRTAKKGITFETPNGNYIEIEEESDATENHSLNVKITGTRNEEATEAINVTLDPGKKLANDAPARDITIKATSEDNNGVYEATAVLDTKGNVAVTASGDINLAKASANIQITEDENSGKSQIKLNADEILLTADDIKLIGDVEVGVGKDLTVHNGALPVVLNTHAHTVLTIVNVLPPTPHTHPTTVSSPS